MEKKQDLRIRKSLQSIREGFFQCIQKKPFSKITIHDITSTAMVNKTTIYTYYADKYDLREKLVSEALEEFRNNIDISFLNKDYLTVSSYAKDVQYALRFIYKNRQKYQLFWNSNLEMDVFSQMQMVFEVNMRNTLKIQNALSEEERLLPKEELFARMFAGNAMCTIRWWLEYCPETQVEEVAKIITDCISKGDMAAFDLC